MKKAAGINAQTSRAAMLEGVNVIWEEVLSLASRKVYPANYTLKTLNQEIFDFFYLASGAVHIMNNDQEGRERTIFYIGPGIIFNEAPAIAGFDDPDSILLCAKECEIYRFSGTLLHDQKFIARYPHLIVNLMTTMGSKILIMHASLSDGASPASKCRICRFLLSLSHKHGGSLDFAPDLTQDDLAVHLGMHRATVVRVLQDLRLQGIVSKFTKRRFQITNLDLLRDMAGL